MRSATFIRWSTETQHVSSLRPGTYPWTILRYKLFHTIRPKCGALEWVDGLTKAGYSESKATHDLPLLYEGTSETQWKMYIIKELCGNFNIFAPKQTFLNSTFSRFWKYSHFHSLQSLKSSLDRCYANWLISKNCGAESMRLEVIKIV